MNEAELYVVATPLGNRADITLRAIEVLKNAVCIFAEDTREAVKLLELCGISPAGKKIHSYASHNLKQATELALRILQENRRVVLITDRGTPGISDPGALLVHAAREEGVRVVPIPGPSAVSALVSVSGLVDGQFIFWGFLPKEDKHRHELWARWKQLGWAACFFESPRRIRETASELKVFFPHGRIFIGREMTKLHEEYRWLTLAELGPADLPEQGEYAVLLDPGKYQEADAWHREVALRLATDKEWSKDVAARHGVAARDVYNALQQQRRDAQRQD